MSIFLTTTIMPISSTTNKTWKLAFINESFGFSEVVIGDKILVKDESLDRFTPYDLIKTSYNIKELESLIDVSQRSNYLIINNFGEIGHKNNALYVKTNIEAPPNGYAWSEWAIGSSYTKVKLLSAIDKELEKRDLKEYMEP